MRQGLTLTEARIARLLADGKSDGEVARLLGMERAAVDAELALIYRKLGIESRTELALLLGEPVTEPSEERGR